MTADRTNSDPSSWDPALDAVTAAPKQHKVLFENERLRVLEVTLEGHECTWRHNRLGASTTPLTKSSTASA